MVSGSCWIWFLIILQLNTSGFKRLWRVMRSIRSFTISVLPRLMVVYRPIGNLNLVVRPGRRLVILVCTIYIYMIRLRPIWIGIIRPYDKRVPPLSISGGKRACRVFVSMSSTLPVKLRSWWTHLRGSLARRCILTPPLFMII